MSELKLQQCRLDGRYDVLDCLGRGSYSEVYVARDAAALPGTPHTVVIKALNTHLQGVPDSELEQTLLDNFRNEAVALDRVRHPNVINRLGHGTAIDLQSRVFHYLVLEYLPGGDLQALCRRRALSLEDALFYLGQVCAGLEHAHNHEVIHRDIKPQNLLLTADHKTVKIADFGVAKIEAAEGAITRVGTDVYAAPEHHPLSQTGPLDTASLMRPPTHLTPAADVYSLAKTAYMLLTGEAPRRFSRRPITELPEPFADAAWAPFVIRVLRRATQTNPESRYQSVGEFWNELKDATMPRTQLLDEKNSRPASQGNGAGAAESAALHASVPPAPPAPTFERPVEPSPGRRGTSANPRIIVPIRHEETGPYLPARPTQVSPANTFPVEHPYAPSDAHDEKGSRLSPRARNWLVALFLIVAFAAILLATHNYVRRLRPDAGGGEAQTTSSSASVIGRDFVATTDVKLRHGPTATGGNNEIGLAERDSVVEVLGVSGRWYKVRVKEHGRPKKDPDSADEGWAYSTYLRAK
jgi:serine/threonine protein kinase